ncbi:MAG: hypothetical protein CMD65_01045 [Gammaproteobacteria bacterium]|nr:hypothetical protein [Gammaproteobacteria bacterium]
MNIRIILLFLTIFFLYWINKKINKEYDYIRYIIKILIIILSFLLLFILAQYFMGSSLLI